MQQKAEVWRKTQFTSNISKIDVGVVCQDSLGTLTNTNNNKTTYETAINKVNTLQK